MRRKTEEKRREILAGAARTFQARGFHDTTLNDIAREVGCSKVTIYNYFASREELLKTLILEGYRPALAHLTGLLKTRKPLAERLKSFACAYLTMINNQYSILMIRLTVTESGRHDFGKAFDFGTEHDVWSLVHQEIAKEIAETGFPHADPVEMAAHLRAQLHGGSHYQHLIGALAAPDPALLAEESERAVDRALGLF